MMRSRVAARFAASSVLFTQKRFDHGTAGGCGSKEEPRKTNGPPSLNATGSALPLTPEVSLSFGSKRRLHHKELPEALHRAVWSNAVEDAALLIRHGVDVNAIWGEYPPQTPLQAAANLGHVDMAKLLLENGANVNAVGYPSRSYPSGPYRSRSTPLHGAVNSGHVDLVNVLLDHGADVNAKNYGGCTPLDVAATRLDIAPDELSRNRRTAAAITKVLLDHDADPTAVDKDGVSPLHRAACGRDDVAKVLIDHGADVNAKLPDGVRVGRLWSCGGVPLHAAAEDGTVAGVELLIRSGADVNATDSISITALHIAVAIGRTDVVQASLVKLLIDHGADVNARSKDGRTPLHFAVKRGHVDIAELLLENGADVNAGDGKTPLQLAAELPLAGGRSDFLQLFGRHGAFSTPHDSASPQL